MAFLPLIKFPIPTAKPKGGKTKSPMFLTDLPLLQDPLPELFFKIVQQNLSYSESPFVKFVELPELADTEMKVHVPPTLPLLMHKVKLVKLETYADYIKVRQGESTFDKIEKLGYMCAGAYNALFRNAKEKGGTDPVDGNMTVVYVPGLFTNNLRFNHLPAAPSVVDPTKNMCAWVAYQFKFAVICMETQ